jgi:hypothetical protein
MAAGAEKIIRDWDTAAFRLAASLLSNLAGLPDQHSRGEDTKQRAA